MHVESYSVSVHSQHFYLRREEVTRTVRLAAEPVNLRQRGGGPEGGTGLARHKPDAMSAIRPRGFDPPPRRSCAKTGEKGLNSRLEGLKALVEKLVEVFTGKKIRIRILEWPQAENGLSPYGDMVQASPVGIEFRFTRDLVEEERAIYVASGKVKTSDGREVAFWLVLSMEREWKESESQWLLVGGRTQDPLVVVVDGSHARLSEQIIEFDLDLDGIPDRVPVPAPGSGFLVIDHNGDGQLNDGGELFGPISGDGFGDLSRYDLDGNGWIDEGDPVFRDLRVWMWDGGRGRMYTLPELGLGAIFLRSAETPFTLRDGPRQRGRIGSTSFWLGEDGRVGVVQHLDIFL